MKKDYKLVIFDLDGTLLNTKQGIIDSVKYTISKHGLPTLSEDKIDNFIGPPIQNSFQRVYGVSGSALQELAETFRNRYKNYDLLKANIYDGVVSMLSTLKNNKKKIAVATYKREDYAIKILKAFNLYSYFDIVHGGDNYNVLKKSDIIEKCIMESGVKNRSEVLLVGDTINDEIGACEVGVDFLGVLYGFGFKEKEEKGRSVIGFVNNPYEILVYTIIN